MRAIRLNELNDLVAGRPRRILRSDELNDRSGRGCVEDRRAAPEEAAKKSFRR